MAKSFAIIAHRGDSDNAPENTIPAFELALERGFPAFEADCQLTADGACVLIHCEELGRTTNGSGRVAEKTLEEIKQLDAGSWFSPSHAGVVVPTLEEVLKRFKGRAHMHLELKSQQAALADTVAALVRRHGWDAYASHGPSAPATDAEGAGAAAAGDAPAADSACAELAGGGTSLCAVPGLTITSFHYEQIKRSKELLPSVRHAWLIQEWEPQRHAARARAAGFEVLCPRANALTRGAILEMKREGFAVRAWGIKTTELLLHAVECGADGATVNWPEKGAEALLGLTEAHS